MIKRWQEDRGKYVEFDIKTMNKYNKYYEEMKSINPEKNMEGIGIDQLEEPFISFGLAYNREEINCQEKLFLSISNSLDIK